RQLAPGFRRAQADRLSPEASCGYYCIARLDIETLSDTIAPHMIPGMQTRRVEPDITVVELIGSLSLGNTLSWIETDIRGQIKEGMRKLVIDISQLRYTDSAGIGMFITVNGEIEQASGQLRIAGATGIVAKSFTVTHLDRVIFMDADVEAACAKFRV